jgi:hypothetical protein
MLLHRAIHRKELQALGGRHMQKLLYWKAKRVQRCLVNYYVWHVYGI